MRSTLMPSVAVGGVHSGHFSVPLPHNSEMIGQPARCFGSVGIRPVGYGSLPRVNTEQRMYYTAWLTVIKLV